MTSAIVIHTGGPILPAVIADAGDHATRRLCHLSKLTHNSGSGLDSPQREGKKKWHGSMTGVSG